MKVTRRTAQRYAGGRFAVLQSVSVPGGSAFYCYRGTIATCELQKKWSDPIGTLKVMLANVEVAKSESWRDKSLGIYRWVSEEEHALSSERDFVASNHENDGETHLEWSVYEGPVDEIWLLLPRGSEREFKFSPADYKLELEE